MTWMTYMRPHPEDGMESGLLVAVDCLVARGEVLVFEQLSAVWLGAMVGQNNEIANRREKYIQ